MTQLNDILNNLLMHYEGYFTISRPYVFNGEDILAYARFEQRMSKYLMVKRAQLFAVETHEHVFFIHERHLTMDAWEREKSRIVLAEKDYVKPHKEHMFSYITLILLCDQIDADVEKAIRRFRYTKNYKWTIEGYSTVRVCALDLSSEKAVYNARAKDVEKVMEQALHM